MSKRQPEGIPTGGQFAADRKGEPASSLTSGARDPREDEVQAAMFVKVHHQRRQMLDDAEQLGQDLSRQAEQQLGTMVRRIYPNTAQVEVEVELNADDDGTDGAPTLIAAVDANGDYIDGGSDAWTRGDNPLDEGMSPVHLAEHLRPNGSWGEPKEVQDEETGATIQTYRIPLS